MKGFLCQKKMFSVCFLVCFSLFACFFLLSGSTNALSLSTMGSITASGNSYITVSLDGNSSNPQFSNSADRTRYTSSQYYSNYFSSNYIRFSPSSNIPSGSVASLSISFRFMGDADFERPYDSPSAMLIDSATTDVQVLNYTCYDSDSLSGTTKTYSLTCDIMFYFAQSRNGYFGFVYSLSSGNNGSTTSVAFRAYLSKLNYRIVDFDALTDNDKDWLTDDFAEAIANAVAEGQKDADEEQKQQAETQASDSETEANTQGGDSSTQGQTLLQAFSGFVSAITNVQPANSCEFDLDFSGYNPNLTATVDLCEFPLPSGLTFIGSILLILFCVPLSISTVRKMIGLFRSFQT